MRAFSFGEEPAPPEAENQGMEWQPEPPAESEETFVFSAVAVPPLPEKEAETATFAAEEETKEVETEHIDSGDISGGVTVAGPVVTITEEIKPALEETTVPPEPVPEMLSAPSFASSTPSAEEELPPLAISTRRKGSSIFAIVVTAIAVLIVFAIAGFGFYVFKEGPAAFDKLKLSFLARWVGMDAAEEGGIAIKNPQGAFMVNRVAGDIFVISGEAVNNFKKPRASIQVKAIVLGPKGETLMQKTRILWKSSLQRAVDNLADGENRRGHGKPVRRFPCQSRCATRQRDPLCRRFQRSAEKCRRVQCGGSGLNGGRSIIFVQVDRLKTVRKNGLQPSSFILASLTPEQFTFFQ